jgi:hypothetical protein
MTRASRAVALAGAGAIALGLAVPGIALADDQTATARLSRTAGADAESTIYSSYTSALGSKKTIVGTYEVPTLDCTATDEGIISIVELASTGGADYVDGSVYSFCSGGSATYTARFESSTEGQNDIAETVQGGDMIKVSSTFKGGDTKVTIQNLTRDWSAKDTISGVTPAEGSVMHYSMTLGGNPLPPPDYGSVNVKNVQISGKDLKNTKPTKVVMVDDSGKPVIKPTKIKKGTDFKFKYVA